MIDLAKLKISVDKKEVDDAKASIQNLASEIPGLGSKVDSLTNTFSKLATPLTAAAAAFSLAAAGALQLAADAISANDELGKLADTTGRATEELQGLQEVAKKSGGDLGSLTTTLDKLSVKMVKLGDEDSANFTKALDYFGVSLTNANGEMKTSQELAVEIAEAYVNTERTVYSQAAAVEVLGKNYESQINTLTSLNDLELEMEKNRLAGAVASAELIAASEEYNDSLDDLDKITRGIGNYTSATFLPLLTGMAKAIFDSATNGGILNTALDLLGKMLTGVAGILKVAATAVIGLDNGFQMVNATVNLTLQLFQALAAWDFSGAAAAFDSYANSIVQSSAKANAAIAKLWSNVPATGPGIPAAVGIDRGALDLSKPAGTKPAGTKPAGTKPAGTKPAGKSIYQQDLESMNQYVDRLRTQASTIGMNSDELATYNLHLEASKLKTKSLQNQMIEHGQVYLDVIAARRAEAEAIKDNNAAFEQAMKIEDQRIQKDEKAAAALGNMRDRYLDLADPNRKYVKELEEINQLMEKFPEHADSWTDAAMRVQEKMVTSFSGGGGGGGGSSSMKKALTEQEQAIKDLTTAVEGYVQKMSDAFVEFAVTGKMSFSDMVSSMLLDLARMLANQAFKEIFKMMGVNNWASSIVSWFTSANGNVFSGGAPVAFASGGLINQPVTFPLANGAVGRAGEAGTEAIVPLKRGPNGRLGIESYGATNASSIHNTNFTIENINVTADENTDGKVIGREIGQQIKAIVINTLYEQKRPGNALNPITLGTF